MYRLQSSVYMPAISFVKQLLFKSMVASVECSCICSSTSHHSSLTHTLTITCTCCCDEIKGTQDLSCSFSNSLTACKSTHFQVLLFDVKSLVKLSALWMKRLLLFAYFHGWLAVYFDLTVAALAQSSEGTDDMCTRCVSPWDGGEDNPGEWLPLFCHTSMVCTPRAVYRVQVSDHLDHIWISCLLVQKVGCRTLAHHFYWVMFWVLLARGNKMNNPCSFIDLVSLIGLMYF